MEYDKLNGVTLGTFVLTELAYESSVNIIATYRAIQPSLKRSVAVQVLNPELGHFKHSFLKGAEIIASLEHPNISPVYECGEQDEFAFIAMRLMTGGTLMTRIRQNPLSSQEATSVIRQISNALDYVHSRNMVHGDPSTNNIIFDLWGSAYLADFVVAGLLQQGEGITGTPFYMSPERWREEPVTPASDQYALGAVTYHMITGQPPFPTRNIGELAQNHLHDMPVRLASNFPDAVNDVLFRALAKKPEDRYPTVMDFAREFEKAIQAVPQHLFISYSRSNKDYAGQLTDHLGHNGFEVWIDSKIDYGDAWFDEIDDAIKNCAAFLLIMTPEAQASEWVKKEILLAKRYKKPIFPLLLEGDEFPIVIDIQFADVKGGVMPDTNFHRRLRRTVFGDV